MKTRSSAIRVVVGAIVLAWAPFVLAQNHPIFDATGFQQNRDYFSALPFEHVDTLQGGLTLTFTDLVLPGNNGFDVKFQRSYNSKRSVWTFGIAGVPMYVQPGTYPPPVPFNPDTIPRPKLVTSDGAEHRTAWMDSVNSTSPTTTRWVVTSKFWRYDRLARTAYLPNGMTSHYDDSGRLIHVSDAFGNVVTLTWNTGAFSFGDGTLVVQQFLGNGQTRSVNVHINNQLPLSMEYGGRVWNYDYIYQGSLATLLTRATPPVSPSWEFSYNDHGELNFILTPQRGEISYSYGDHEFLLTGQNPNNTHILSRVVGTRTTGGRGIEAGVWTYTYDHQVEGERTTIETPSHAKTIYIHNYLGTSQWDPSIESEFGVIWRFVLASDGHELEQEKREYVYLPVGPSSDSPELLRRTITRNNRAYVTEFSYNTADVSRFADFHRPFLTSESGELLRSTLRSFDYGFNLTRDGLPYFSGALSAETVTVNGESFAKSFSWNHTTGFLESQIEYGIRTSFEPDHFGNVASVVKGNGTRTTSSYAWGVVNGIETSEFKIARSVNSEGTVASETKGGRTTEFRYDEIFRVKMVLPPGGTNPTLTDFNDADGTVTVRRGRAVTTTAFDGFGRPIFSINGAAIQTRTGYDAEGRRVYEGYPFEGPPVNDKGTRVSFDSLGRVVERRNPDNTTISYEYGAGSITITNENGWPTLQTRQAFGDPDDTRLSSLTNAEGDTWQYAYNALGRATRVTAPDGIIRQWTYGQRNLLDAETQPESGTITYEYDAAGLLKAKHDARGTTFSFLYDGNDRVRVINAGGKQTIIDYESGTDNRGRLAAEGGDVATFEYDTAGRLRSRTDVLDFGPIQQVFDYDENDNLRKITYGSGQREIEYRYDDENRVLEVRDLKAGRAIASGFQYHPSGAVTQFVSGNGVVNHFEYDDRRYWPTSVAAGELNLTYRNHDGVGNIGTVVDARPGNGPSFSQSFTYDKLDRLRYATSPSYGYVAYNYDAHGNRVTNELAAYSYEPGKLRLQSNGTNSFSYDNNGNLTVRSSPNAATFTYAPDNTMTSAETGAGTTEYEYDGDGWRVKKIAGGEATYYIRGPHGELMSELSKVTPDSRVSRDYIYAGSRLLASILSNADATAKIGVKFTVTPTNVIFPRAGGSTTLHVRTTPTNTQWSVTNLPSWLHGAPGGFGSNSSEGAPYELTADPNQTNQPRNKVITVAGVAVTVTQGTLAKGQLLPHGKIFPGDRIYSDNDLYYLEFTTGGKLELHMVTCDWLMWRADGHTDNPGYVQLDDAGALHMFDDEGDWVWSMDVPFSWGASVFVQGDGNLVAYDTEGEVVWATHTEQLPAAHLDTMYEGERLDGALTSLNGKFELRQSCGDGNITLKRLADGQQLWPNIQPIQAGGAVVLKEGAWQFYSTHEFGRWKVREDIAGDRPAVRLAMQGDGNLVLYDADGLPVWDSHTQQFPFATGDAVRPNEQLGTITSNNGKFRFAHDLGTGRIFHQRVADGELLWDENISGLGPAVMLPDGRFVLYAQPFNPAVSWLRPNNGSERAGSQLRAQDNGNVVIEDENGFVTWELGYVEYEKVTSGNTVYVGQQLGTLTSANGKYQYSHTQGHLVLTRTSDGQVLYPRSQWDQDPYGVGPAALLASGEFVIYDQLRVPRTPSSLGSAGPNAHITLDNEGGVWIYNSSGEPKVLLVPAWDQLPAHGDTLHLGEDLSTLTSVNGLITLTLQSDGNVVLRGEGNYLWDSKTNGWDGGSARLSVDGRFVVYDANRTTSKSFPDVPTGHPNAVLQVFPDGNLILHDGGQQLWQTYTRYTPPSPPAPTATGDKLYLNQRLRELWSDDGNYYLVHQASDSNIVLYKACGGVVGEYLWASFTNGQPTDAIAQLNDLGWFELVTSDGSRQLWRTMYGATDDLSHPNEYLIVQNDGNLVLYDSPGGPALWAASWEPGYRSLPPCTTEPPGPSPEDPNAEARLNGGDHLGTLTSPNGQWQLTFDSGEGNVILYNNGGRVWDMGAVGGFRAVMQDDGNFVVYDDGGNSHPQRWLNNGGYNGQGWFLRLTNDGRLELCNGSGQVQWSRGDPVHP